MKKSEQTLQLEESIYLATNKTGVFGCFEVTIGWNGQERVDYITYDTKGVWRCYEIKASVSDFHSSAAKTFVGHYNYFVLTQDLYCKVEHEIPDEIGIYVGKRCIRHAKRKALGVDEQILFNSLIRSLYREYQLKRSREDHDYIVKLQRTAKTAQEENQRLKRQRNELTGAIIEVFGNDGRKKIRDYLDGALLQDIF